MQTKPASRVEHRKSMLFQLFLVEHVDWRRYAGKGQHFVAVTIVQWVHDTGLRVHILRNVIEVKLRLRLDWYSGIKRIVSSNAW
jgi:hypothetical protein